MVELLLGSLQNEGYPPEKHANVNWIPYSSSLQMPDGSGPGRVALRAHDFQDNDLRRMQKNEALR